MLKTDSKRRRTKAEIEAAKEAKQNQEFELQSAEIQKEILKEQLEIAE